MIINHPIYRSLYENKDKFIILVTGGRGCEDPETPVMMADLTIKKIKDIKVGDKVMGDDGTPRNVLETVSGRSMMYKVHQQRWENYIINDAHVLCLKDRTNGEIVEIPLFMYMALPNTEREKLIGYSKAYPTEESEIWIEQIGDGDYFGIHIDGNHRYVGGDGTVKRNSGKSFSTSTFIERLTFELGYDLNNRKISHQILYSRYTMVSAGMSIIPEVMDKIAADGVSKYFARSGQDIVNVMTGSHIMFRGIRTSSGNQTAKLKSIKGLTVFVCDEAEEFVSEEDFEKIMFSIRQQGLKNLVIIIMNPTDSNHFIYQKYIKDTHKLVEYDGVPVQISTHPNVLHIHTSYLDNLKYLAPNFLEEAKAMKERDPERYAHIFMGKWSDVAEGAIFKKWGIVKEFPDYCKKVALAMDLGYSSDPTAIVKCGIVDNRLYMQEIKYETGMLSSDIIKVLKPYTQEGVFTYSESADPRLIDEIGLGGVIIYPVQKGAGSIIAGIDKMQTMELFVTEDSLNIQEELRNYTWAKDKDDKWTNTPIDKYNHCFVGDTLITTDKGEVRIDKIKEGDKVLTSNGYRRVTKFFNQGRKEIVEAIIELEDLVVTMKVTPEHKIKTDKGWKQVQHLKQGEVIFLCKSSMGKNITYMEGNAISQEEQTAYTKLSGDTIKEKFPKGIMFTIKMVIRGIMTSPILNSLKHTNIYQCICRRNCKTRNNLPKCEKQWTMRESLQTNGMGRQRELNGIANTVRRLPQKLDSILRNLFVKSAERNLRVSKEILNSAQTSADQSTDCSCTMMMKNESALFAENHLLLTNTTKPSVVAGNVGKDVCQTLEKSCLQNVEQKTIKRITIHPKPKQQVYDIEVEEMHEFFANGVLVHNCMDAVRYYVLAVLLGKVMKPKKVTKEQLGIF